MRILPPGNRPACP